MSEYTPTTDEVRDYIRAADRVTAHMFSAESPDAVEAFDLWLSAHDAEVRAGVVAEEPEWEYGVRHRLASSVTKKANLKAAELCAQVITESSGIEIEAVQRVAAGPWVPVKQGSAD